MLKPILITRRFLSSSSAVTVWIQIVKYKWQLRDKPRHSTARAVYSSTASTFYACNLDSRVKYKTQPKTAGLNTMIEWRQEKNCPPVDGGDAMLWTHVKFLAVP